MTLRHLKIFVMVVEMGKMSAAAKKLYITQPTVSQAIKELEKHYGVLLFERIGKKLYITDAGRQLLSQAHLVLHQYTEMEESMANQWNKEILRVGSTITIGSCLLPPVIHQLHQEYSNLKTFGYVNNTERIEEKILRAELDIAIVEGTIKSKEINCFPIMKDELVIACGAGHPFSQKKNITDLDLHDQFFVMREKGSGTRELFEKYLYEKSISFEISWEVTSSESIKEVLKINEGISAISIRLIEKELRSGELCAFTNEKKEWQRDFLIIYHKHKHIGRGMKALIDLLRNFDGGLDLTRLNLGTLISNED